jgi:hypothetical protein
MAPLKKTATKKPYFLLSQSIPLTEDLFDRLLGLAVVRYDAPLMDYKPLYPFKPQDVVNHLYPESCTVVTNVQISETLKKDSKAAVRLQNFVNASRDRQRSSGATLEAPVFRSVMMDNGRQNLIRLLRSSPNRINGQPINEEALVEVAGVPENNGGGAADAQVENRGLFSRAVTKLIRVFCQIWDFFYALFDQEPTRATKKLQYQREVKELLRERKKLGLVVGFITLVDPKKSQALGKGGKMALKAGVPQEVSNVKVDAELSSYSGCELVSQGTYQGEYVIACSYLPLTLKVPKANRILGIPWTDKVVTLFNSKDDAVSVSVSEFEDWDLGDVEIPGDMRAPFGPEWDGQNVEREGSEERSQNYGHQNEVPVKFLVLPNDEDPESEGEYSDASQEGKKTR